MLCKEILFRFETKLLGLVVWVFGGSER